MILFAFLLFGVSIAEGDRELALRLKRRDPTAMADLYDRFGRVAYSVVFTIVRDTGVAEDLVQETFQRVWNRMNGFDAERGALGPWLLTVARNRAIDHIRSASARMSRNAYELEEREHPSLFANAEEQIVTADQARRIRLALTTLNEKQKRVIEMAYFEGLSQAEIAEKLEQPLGTVKTWARTALKRLREELERAPRA
jgi:RNA polymerase sigma-70 factor (ECF subfamily)